MTDAQWQDRRVAVTGATGLVGSCLAQDLVRRGSRVSALVLDSDPQSEFIRSGTIGRTRVANGGLEDYSAVERLILGDECDTVFHLGAQTLVGTAYRAPLATFEANIRGSYNLLEACRRHDKTVKRVIIASSDKAYGAGDHLPYDEDMPLVGRYPYDVSKSCTDLIAQSYFHTYGLPVVIARCGNIYGGGDLNWSRIVPGTIRALHKGQRPTIRSDGQSTRDYVFVEDAAMAYLTMAEQLSRPDVKGQAFNFGPAQPMKAAEVVDKVRKAMGREDLLPIVLNESKAEIRDQYLDSRRAKEVLGWSPKFSFEAGIAKAVDWYRGYFGKGSPA